ncbi:unnamed protein product [Durusdinium trenchii]|uniref:Uncharacterized protein n=1 Tax=Durusdinium trenchii TaxID=1381693 RepID=A0ABP0JCF9_9DINO
MKEKDSLQTTNCQRPRGTSGLLAISRASLIPASLKQLSVAVFAATLSMYTVEMWVSEQFMGLLLWCGFLTPVWLVEFERLKNADAAKRTKLLSQGFSGIMDAACASEIDQRNIHAEILQSGMMQEVETAVDVLLSSNSSTVELQRTVALVGQLGDVTNFSRMRVLVGVIFWIEFPILNYVAYMRPTRETPDPPLEPALSSFLMALQGCLWLLLFACLSTLRRSFATALLNLWLICLPLMPQWAFIGGRGEAYSLLGAWCIGPFILIASVAGPFRVARVPLVGVPIVWACLGRWTRCWRQIGSEGRATEEIQESKESNSSVPEEDLQDYFST